MRSLSRGCEKTVHKALAHCLINADYYGARGVVIKSEPDRISYENPGYIRTGKIQMRKGASCIIQI